MAIIMSFTFWFSAVPLSEWHQCDHKEETEETNLLETDCHDHQDTCDMENEAEDHHHHHGDHDCTPQCHCKCFSPHFFIEVQETEVLIARIAAPYSAKPITFTQSDYSPGVFQPPRFI